MSHHDVQEFGITKDLLNGIACFVFFFTFEICKDKLRLRISGDLHHYTRHEPKEGLPDNFEVIFQIILYIQHKH